MKTVLVTGVGAIMGYGVLRSLRETDPTLRLIGADIYPDAVGRAWVDVFEQAEHTVSPQYFHWLEDIVKKYQVDLLIPGIEQDVHRLSDARDKLTGLPIKIVLNNQRLIDLSRDKWAMHEELKTLNDTCRIPATLTGDYETLASTLGLPFLLKPRRSYASKGLIRIENKDDFEIHAKGLGEHFMAQTIVGSDEGEYTVAAFGDGKGHISASIILQRRLAPDGSTAKAWVRQSKSLDETVARLCAHFEPLGPTNLQFRREGENWKLLEINPRISSTTSMRRAFGYNEAAMSLDYYLNGKLPSQPKFQAGFAARYIEDYVIHDRDHF